MVWSPTRKIKKKFSFAFYFKSAFFSLCHATFYFFFVHAETEKFLGQSFSKNMKIKLELKRFCGNFSFATLFFFDFFVFNFQFVYERLEWLKLSPYTVCQGFLSSLALRGRDTKLNIPIWILSICTNDIFFWRIPIWIVWHLKSERHCFFFSKKKKKLGHRKG